jgi:hypothetical protein
MQGSSASPTARRDWWWLFDPRTSLRARVALTVGSAAVAFTLLLSWSTGILFRRALETHLASTFETLAFQVGDKLDRAVYERYRTLQTAASLATIRDPALPVAERRRVLEVLQETSPEFAWLGLTDDSGRIVAATNRMIEGTSAETRPWFRNGREYPYVGAVRELSETERERMPSGTSEGSVRHLDLAVPVIGANGQFAGVLTADLRWNWSREIPGSVVSEIAARDGIGVTVYGPNREVLLDSEASGWTQPPEAPPVGEGRRFRGSLFETSSGGTINLAGYSRSRGFREYRGIGWLTVVRQPGERAFAGVASLRRGIILWGGFLTMVAVVASWVIAGEHARRLRSVRAAAERIRVGDILSVLPRPKGDGEIAAMCGALGDLVEDLRARQEKLSAENTRLAAHIRGSDAAKH